MKAITLALALSLLLGGSAAQAQNTQAHQGAPARQELRAYYQQNVLPVVRQQRQKLEAQLSTSDKAQLTLYRAQLKETRQKGKALRQSFRPAGTPAGTRPELTETQKQQLQQLRAENKAILQNVGQLAQKYEGAIAKLAQEVQPQREKWAADTKAILSRTGSAGQPAAAGSGPGRHQRHAGLRRHFQPVAFLLLDPNAPQTKAPDPERGGVSVYPNPVATTSQLEYEVKKAGPVTVELLDSRGNTLRTVAQENKVEKGAHTLSVSVADLPAGTYYFKITTRAGAETRRFVKQ
ncbi:T9SS type A sorting domain-containing protein [Hymenobacter sp. HSC-4F20]|uniref:T9SS type A sorting domain-containing protein n=1 Tax=Hymenobacter sp. HSC-4F20 TaxID=2864135 RepID=UPI001C72CA20|nr:T9SS type A sorting domain-containing protein [Hymenobacter sp. HSC-4F20]MBX0291968.1 T9SS type A sorting domain-containing protein [Hymenobacter sp. HSC-4F20]